MALTKTEWDSKEVGIVSLVDQQMIPAPASGRLPWLPLEKAFVLVASIVFAVCSIGSMRNESVTTNEVAHLPAGLSYLQRLDARMNIEHPPLIKVIAALPVVLLHGKADYNDPIWNASDREKTEYIFGGKFFASWNANHRILLFAARLPMVALTLLLGLSLFEMARRLAGRSGAALVLSLFVTSPFFLANGPLVMTDVPIALFSLWTMWYFASLWQAPTLRNALLFATSFAGALLTKYSAVFLFPTILLCWVWFRFSNQRSLVSGVSVPSSHKGFRREQLAIGAMLLSAIFAYIFYVGMFHRSDPLAILQDEVASIQTFGGPTRLMDHSVKLMMEHPILQRILLPLWLYVGGLGFVIAYGSRAMYFLGRWYPHGVWYYFPVISFFKLAPGMVLLFFLLAALATANFLHNKRAGISVVSASNRFHLHAILAALVVFALIPMASNLNVGVRHFSVPITLSVLLCALIVPLTSSVFGSKARPFAFGVIIALAFSSVVTAAITYPHYLSYYNIFRLNVPKQEIAINSNLSLGQSMEELAAFFNERHIAAPYVDTRTSELDPAVYVPGARAWQCDKPNPVAPEWVAVTTIAMLHQPPNCEYLLRYPSWNIGDGAIVVFHLTDSKSAP
jgi:hypothetical protein